ncbi:helix-turn-helix domain-containing protein [Vagococcus sp. BWB3-3]|uniref:Helix-turn-helix domain-containing protein n=1 Tax=Vagococcus allomyrinae TaxID=2794353 RepID=A0A940PA64_9ENTE|nr:helix-turn-helix domain-containing protein [Vagococcus allomyrinae]MBP1040802.1 helix-turn-helix domain-containing protein [Vagococcus allomyrinae]
MTTFLDKNEKRDLDILYHLYSEDKLWSAEELATVANCSVKSVTSSVSTLNELISEYDLDCWIQIERHLGIRLCTDSYASIYHLESLYIQNTITYQLMDKLFHERDLSITKLQDAFFLSRSSIYRKLAIIETFILSNGFNFSKTELTITGPEASIREFFYLFYISIADDHFWPFKTVSQAHLENKLVKIEEASHFKLSYAEKLRVLYRLAINSVRYQQKHYVLELPDIVKIAPNLEVELAAAAEYFMEGIPVKYQQLEYQYLSLVYLTYANTIEVNNTLGIEEAVDWNRKEKTKAYELVAELLDKMSNIYPQLDLSEYFASSLFIYKLISVANYALLYPMLDVDLDLNDRWNKRFRSLTFSSLERPKFTEVLWELIVEIHEENNRELINPHHVFYFIYSVFNQSLDLHIFENTLKIKLIMEAGYLSESELKEKLARLLGNDAKIVTSDIRNDEKEPYDLIISDLPFLTIDYPDAKQQYIWAFPPMKRDWQNIKMMTEMLSFDSQKEKDASV